MHSLDRKRKLTPNTLPGIVKCVNSTKSSNLSLFSLYFISILSLFYLYGWADGQQASHSAQAPAPKCPPLSRAENLNDR